MDLIWVRPVPSIAYNQNNLQLINTNFQLAQISVTNWSSNLQEMSNFGLVSTFKNQYKLIRVIWIQNQLVVKDICSLKFDGSAQLRLVKPIITNKLDLIRINWVDRYIMSNKPSNTYLRKVDQTIIDVQIHSNLFANVSYPCISWFFKHNILQTYRHNGILNTYHFNNFIENIHGTKTKYIWFYFNW